MGEGECGQPLWECIRCGQPLWECTRRGWVTREAFGYGVRTMMSWSGNWKPGGKRKSGERPAWRDHDRGPGNDSIYSTLTPWCAQLWKRKECVYGWVLGKGRRVLLNWLWLPRIAQENAFAIWQSVCVCLSLSRVWFLEIPWTVALQAPLSMGTLQRRIPEWVAISYFRKGFPGGSDDKESTCHAYPGSIPGLERSPGEEYGYPRQSCCLENPWTEEPGGIQSIMGSQSVRQVWETNTFTPGRGTQKTLSRKKKSNSSHRWIWSSLDKHLFLRSWVSASANPQQREVHSPPNCRLWFSWLQSPLWREKDNQCYIFSLQILKEHWKVIFIVPQFPTLSFA